MYNNLSFFEPNQNNPGEKAMIFQSFSSNPCFTHILGMSFQRYKIISHFWIVKLIYPQKVHFNPLKASLLLSSMGALLLFEKKVALKWFPLLISFITVNFICEIIIVWYIYLLDLQREEDGDVDGPRLDRILLPTYQYLLCVSGHWNFQSVCGMG